MSYYIFPMTLSLPYRERFVHNTARAEMGGGRLVTSALIGSAGLFAAEGGVTLPQGSTTFDTLAAFVAARRGGYDSFLYLPAYDYHGTSAAEAVATTTNGVTLYALDYAYPKAGTLTVTLDGSPLIEDSTVSLADSDGNAFSLGEVPYLKLASNPGAGKALVATYRFYIPVRFESDDPIGDLTVVRHTGDSSADSYRSGVIQMRQDYPGSHLVTVPSP